MRRFVQNIGLLSFALMTFGVGASAAGCFPFYHLDDCEEILSCVSGVGSSGSGADGGPDPACAPSENREPVSDDCGVFVATSGEDANEGTKERPVATLAKAVELSVKRGGRVYACAEMFTEALVLDVAVEVYGGLECDKAWAYVGDEKKTTLTAGADAVPLILKSGASDARIVDFAIHAADAVMAGGSSIAVLADGATAELAQCELVAGNGVKGSAGAPGDPNGMSTEGASREGGPRRAVLITGITASALGVGMGVVFAVVSGVKASEADEKAKELRGSTGKAYPCAAGSSITLEGCSELHDLAKDKGLFQSLAFWTILVGGAAGVGTVIYGASTSSSVTTQGRVSFTPVAGPNGGGVLLQGAW